MARYVGDLTDPNNGEERQRAAKRVNEIVESIQNREIRSIEITYDREIIGSGVSEVSPAFSNWAVGLGVTMAPLNRHEKMEPFRSAGKHEKRIEFRL